MEAMASENPAVTKEKTNTPEKESSVIKIPESLAQELKVSAAQTIEAIETESPDLLVVLQRSGTQLFNVVEALGEETGITLPPKIDVTIGRRTFQRFLEEVVIPTAGEDARWETETYTLDQYSTELNQWIETSQYAQRICDQLAQTFESVSPQRVMIIDDSVSSGATERMAVLLVREALKKANVENTTVPTHIITADGDWRQKIQQNTFGDLSQNEAYFIDKVSRGTVEAQTGETIPLTTETQLDQLGEETRERFNMEQNPHTDLKTRYGTQQLLDLGKNLDAALKSL